MMPTIINLNLQFSETINDPPCTQEFDKKKHDIKHAPEEGGM